MCGVCVCGARAAAAEGGGGGCVPCDCVIYGRRAMLVNGYAQQQVLYPNGAVYLADIAQGRGGLYVKEVQ